MKWTTVSILGFSILFALGLLLVSRNVAVEPAIAQTDGYGKQAAAAEAEVAAAPVPPAASVAGMTAPLPASCIGKQIYIYDLPPEFNTDLLASYCRGEVPGMQFLCGMLANGGLGPPITESVGQPLPPVEQMVVMSPQKDESTARVRHNLRFYHQLWEESQRAMVPASAWYATELFSLEQVFHSRMQAYPCRTTDPAQAALLYVPYYASLDLDRYMFDDLVPARDWLANRLLGWLTAQPAWRARPDRHLLVLGRDAWDFSRKLHDAGPKAWGAALLTLPPFVPAVKLLVERNLHEATQAAVPYPTGFHPASDADLEAWRAVVAAARRDTLVSFAGGRRTTDTGTVAVALRDRLVAECAAADDARCTVLDCGDVDCTRLPRLVWALNLRSTFCLQPEGDNPTRRATFDALITGCIPVFFTAESAYLQYTWHLPTNFTSWSVFMPAESRELVVPVLAAIPEHQVRAMRETVVGFMENVVYAMPGHDRERSFSDAIDIAIARALAMVNTTTTSTSEAAAPASGESVGS